MADLPLRNCGSRKHWNNICEVLKATKMLTRKLCSVKLYFRNEGKIKAFSHKEKQRSCQQSCSSKILKEIL